MLPIYFNKLGVRIFLSMVVTMFLIGAPAMALIPTDYYDFISLTMMAASLFVGDTILRIRLNQPLEFLDIIRPSSGGHFWFIPIWIFGAIGSILAFGFLVPKGLNPLFFVAGIFSGVIISIIATWRMEE